MKIPTHLLFFAGVIGGGLLLGSLARRSISEKTTGSPHNFTSPVSRQGGNGNGKEISSNPAGPRSSPAAPELPHVRSTDTVETLAAITDGTLYSRLAAWMMDASETDIAAYWESYRKGERSNDITDLVFINWSRLNPRGAIAAVAGGNDEHYAWWAWAAHDPKGALAAALAANPDRVKNVAWGIGEFDPQWLRDHFDQIPEHARGNAMQGFAKWDDGANPLESLKFMKEHDMNFDSGTFKALVNQDPWAAFDWIKENPSLQGGRFPSDGNAMDILFTTMAREHPDDLESLVARTPSGTLKRQMEARLFDNLLTTDPAAALEKAKATDVPLTAVELFAKIGQTLVKTDPEKALEMARAMFAASPGALEPQTRIDYQNGSTWWGSPGGAATDFLNTLLAKEPAKVFDLFQVTENGRISNSETFGKLTSQWAKQDIVGFSNWVNTQTRPEIHDNAAGTLINQLMERKQFSDAIEWSMSSEGMRGNMQNTFERWNDSDPAAAAGWLETANLPENEKATFKSILNRQPKNH